MKMRVRTLLLVLALATLVIGQVQALPWDTPSTHRFWFRGDTKTVNGVLGYLVADNQSSIVKNVYIYQPGIYTYTYVAVRVWLLQPANVTVELTDATYNINVTQWLELGQLKNVTWTSPLRSLVPGSDALQFNIYLKVGNGTWKHKATFVTEHLETDQIINSTWTFRLYIEKQILAGVTYCYFRWGGSSYQSRIDNVQLAKLNPWETMQYHLINADFISFLITPWTYFIGNLFYGFALLFIGVTTYNRYDDVRPVIVLFWIFGGTGGVVTMLIPAVGLNLSWFLLAFALACTLYLLFR